MAALTRTAAKAKANLQLLANGLPFVAEYITPRELFNLVFTCKVLMDALTITAVVKSVMCSGNQHTKITFEILYEMIIKQSIHMPSPVRAIRLANAKFCELCKRHRVKHARRGWGVMVCYGCLRDPDVTQELIVKHYRKRSLRIEDSDIINHPRVASLFSGHKITQHGRYSAYNRCDKHYVWSLHHQDGRGENIGPIVVLQDFNILAALHSPIGMSQYISSVLKASRADEYEEFIEVFVTYRAISTETFELRNQLRIERSIKYQENKLAAVMLMITNLKKMVEVNIRRMHVLQYQVHLYYFNPSLRYLITRKIPCVRFNNGFVMRIMRRHIKAPSKMTKKKLTMLANIINAYFCDEGQV